MTKTGIVYLVGAGPGDPELLTLKALRLMETTDVVVYDRLVSPKILNLIPDSVARIDVGKRPGSHPVPQKSINSILIKLARANQCVVRLKGGDPMIFGRGGEEVEMLERHGISVKTVPGITAAQGCAATLNLPLTQRGIARSLIYLTGHTADEQVPDLNWGELAKADSTLVIYMGAANIGEITGNLIGAGLSGKTPAIAICNGTLDTQKQVKTTISDLPLDAMSAGLDGPILFIVGEAAGQVQGKRELENINENRMLAVASK